MDFRKSLLNETGTVLLGEAVCSAAMVGMFALSGNCDSTVLLGAIVGTAIATGNFFFMVLAATMASQKAVNQDIKGGEAIVRGSYLARMAALLIVLFIFAKSGLCNVITLVVPLIFVRPILSIADFFRKSGDRKL